MEYVLCHHGVKGQRWGIRRYQNADGSLTPAGRKRYENDDGSLNDAGRKFYAEQDRARRAAANPEQAARGTTLAKREQTAAIADAKQAVVNKITDKNTAAAVNSAAEAARKLSATEKQTRKKPEIQKMDLSNMSDKQMRDEINRALLERQYNEMFAPRKVNKGREFVGKALEVGGVMLTTAGAALSIAVMVQQLRGKVGG